MSMFSRKPEKDDEDVTPEEDEEKDENEEHNSSLDQDQQVDMNVDNNLSLKSNQFTGGLKSLTQTFTLKRTNLEMRNLEYHGSHDNLDENSFGRPETSRVEESSVPCILVPRSLRGDNRGDLPQFERSLMSRKHLMFTDNNETAKFPKEELKEEVEEEKELQTERSRQGIFSSQRDNQNVQLSDRNFHENDDGSSRGSDVHNQSNSNLEEEIIGQEDEPDREIDMIIDERITPRVLVESRVNRENSFQTRAEVQSSVENLSHTMPNIQLPMEYHQSHNLVSDRRLFNHILGSGSLGSSDYEDGDNSRLHGTNSLEEQIESIKLNFIHTITHEKQQISESKKELRKHRREFEKRKKQEWEKIQLEKEICKENKKRITKLLKDSEDIIDLDVGGTHHVTTTRATLCRFKNSSLAAMFSGRHSMRYNKDRVFMDRDGEPFCRLIGYLRTGKLPSISDKYQEHLFKEEMNFWQIPFDASEEEEKTPDNQLVPSFDPLW